MFQNEENTTSHSSIDREYSASSEVKYLVLTEVQFPVSMTTNLGYRLPLKGCEDVE